MPISLFSLQKVMLDARAPLDLPAGIPKKNARIFSPKHSQIVDKKMF
jgi:hypothetical protein